MCAHKSINDTAEHHSVHTQLHYHTPVQFRRVHVQFQQHTGMLLLCFTRFCAFACAQFHQALRQELKQLESDALGLERQVLGHLRNEPQHPQQEWPAGQGTQGPQQQQQQQQQQNGVCKAADKGGNGMCGYINRLPRRVAAAMQALDGRFQFLWGIYKWVRAWG